MDINFHYFAVKTIASKAGFSADDAQVIAAYSQFVDDFTMINDCCFKSAVPAFASHLIQKGVLYDTFTTITTGFDAFYEMGRLALWKYQRKICVPFHFIPIQVLPTTIKSGDDTSNYRTHYAIYNGTMLINSLLDRATSEYKTALSKGALERKIALMRVGMTLHIFADTYAHDGYSGFWGWENYSYIEKVTRLRDDADVTGNYNRDTVARAPAIGHANVSHVPDDTFVYFSIKYARNNSENDKSKYSLSRSRSNLQWFCNAAKNIFQYLCALRDQPYTEELWNDVHEILVKGFMFEGTNISELTEKWSAIAPTINYNYNKSVYGDNLLHGYLGEEKPNVDKESSDDELQIIPGVTFYQYADDDFFWYNVLAKEIRDAVIGDEL